MKLLFVVVRDSDGDAVVQSLVGQNFRVTRVASTGGFLKRGNITLMIGVEADRVEEIIDLIRLACSPAAADQNRATVFVVDMPHFEQI